MQQALSVDDLAARSDFITFHVPLTDTTRNADQRRPPAPDEEGLSAAQLRTQRHHRRRAAVAALNSGQLYAYVCDFPSNLLKDHPRVITLPHLGASTARPRKLRSDGRRPGA